MAIPAVSYMGGSGVQKALRRKLGQTKALMGRLPKGYAGELAEGLTGGEYDAHLRRVAMTRGDQIRQDELDFRKTQATQAQENWEEQMEAQEGAAKVGGAVDMVGTGMTSAWMAKEMGLWGGGTKAVAGKTPGVGGGVGGGAGSAGAQLALTDAGASATSIPTSASFAADMEATWAGGEFTAGGMEAVGGAEAPATSFGAYAGAAGLGYISGRMMTSFGIGEQGHTSGAISGAAGGAAAGFVMTGGNPIGAVVGAVFGAIGGGCIFFHYIYGPNSEQERYAKIYCARHMTKKTYIGYIIAATKLIEVCELFPWMTPVIENVIGRSFYRYMLYKLKGTKMPYWRKLIARKLHKWFEWESDGEVEILLHRNCAGCYEAAGGSMVREVA